MRLSNRNKFPAALVKAIENDSYSKGDAEFSITGLLKPARISALEDAHRDEIVEDVEDRLYSLYGQITHLILERANESDLAEKRFFATIDGTRISGQVDTLSLSSGVLTDWKFSTAYKFKPNEAPPSDWVAQLNMQLELLRQNGKDAKSLQIVGLIRDFQIRNAKEDANYPQAPVVTMPIPMWTREETISFISERIAIHKAARERLPECTAEERWAKPDKWAVMKKGNKRAKSLHDSRLEAEDVVSQNPGHFLEFREGVSPRCESYCSVSKFCKQYQNKIMKVAND